MSNKSASLSYSLQYTDEDGKVKTSPVVTVQVPYQSQTVGTIDVPDTTAATTVYDIPFGEVNDAFLIVLDNHTGQSLTVKVNGSSDAAYSLPDGGRYIGQALVNVSDSPTITDLTVTTTDIQSGSGLITYKIFGDPVG